MRTFFIVLGIILAVIVCFYIVLTIFMYKFALVRPKKTPNPRVVDDYSEHMGPFLGFIKQEKDWLFAQNIEEIDIKSFDGLNLKGYLILADKPSKKTVLAIHGYKNCGLNEYSSYVRMYHEMGFNVLIPDDRSHGKSEGKYIGFGWLDRLDCISWAKYIVERFGEDISILLHGISMGSATVMNASGEADLPKQVKGIVADCGFSSAWEQLSHVMLKDFHLHAFPTLYLASLLNKIVCGFYLSENRSVDQVKKAKVPFLFIHGDKDEFVPTKMVYKVYDACASKQKEMHIFEGAAHAESYYVSGEKYVEILKNFLDKIDLGVKQ